MSNLICGKFTVGRNYNSTHDTIISGMVGSNGGIIAVPPVAGLEKLPEKSEELPVGALDFLE